MVMLRELPALFVLVAGAICVNGDGFSEEMFKVRREASIGSYSYTSSDIAKKDSHVKTVSVLKNFEIPEIMHEPKKPVMGKTTVEFWPPDMDKEKFYSMKHDVPMWTHSGVKQMTVVKHIEKLPEKIPDIPVRGSGHSWEYRPKMKDYAALSGPTEATVIDDSSITEAGPVLFPTLEPTTKSPDRQIVFVSRGNSNNKKRKLKKKARPAPVAPLYTGQSETAAPYLNSAIETTAYNQNVSAQDATPIYEVIDEPGPDIFQPIKFTDVVNNLSDLTAQSFGLKPENASKNQVIVIDYPPPINVDTINSNITSYVAPSVTEATPVVLPTAAKPTTIEDLMPLEKFLSQLKQAIDERDIAKIKNIVRLLDEGNVSQPMTQPVLEVKPARVTVRSRGVPRLIRNRTTTEATTSTDKIETTTELVPASDTTFEAARVESTSEVITETVASSEVPEVVSKMPVDVMPILSRGYIAPPNNVTNIVPTVQFGSRNEPTTIATTEEAPATTSSTKIFVTTDESSTFRRSRIYLAPRVRKAKLPKEMGPDEVLKENKIAVTEPKLMTTSLKQVAEWLQPTTTEEMTAAPDPVTTVRPTRRRSRSHNLKIKNHVVRSRQAAKNNIRRRIATRRPY